MWFKCHRKDHPVFELPGSIARTGTQWCPLCCTAGHKRPQTVDSDSDDASDRKRARDSTKAMQAASLERGKKEQQKLLKNAKELYLISKSVPSVSMNSSRSSLLSASRLAAFQSAARVDSIRYNVPENQCLLIHIIKRHSRDPEFWSLLAAGLKTPESVGRDKMYRETARLVHPDKNRHPESDEAFKTLSSIMK